MFSKKIIKFILLTLILTLQISRFSFVKANTSVIAKNDLIINEVNWQGSSLSSTDEWIEVYNNTSQEINVNNLALSGAATKDIFFSGVIKPKDYYLISRFDENSEKSILRVKPDLVPTNTTISLPNTKPFHLILKDKTTNFIIDEVNSNSEIPFAGSSDTDLKTSMSKKAFDLDGNIKDSWSSSDSRVNLDNKITNTLIICGKDLSTPKAQNFSLNPDELTIEFEESCFNEGEVKSLNNNTFLSINGEKKDYNAFGFTHKFVEDISKYKISLFAEGKTAQLNSDLGNFKVELDEQKAIAFNRINFSKLIQNKVLRIEFVKPDQISDVLISLKINLLQDEELLLDKIVITKITEQQSTTISAKDLNTFFADDILDPVSGEEVKFLNKDKVTTGKEYLLENNFSSVLVSDETNNLSKLTFKLKFSNLNPDLSPQTVISLIEITNPVLNTRHTKNIYKKDISEEYKDFSLIITNESIGSQNINLISNGKADMYIHSVVLESTSFPVEETLDNLDIIQTEDFEYSVEKNSIVLDKSKASPSKIIGINDAEKCFNSNECEVTFFIKNYESINNADPKLKIGELFVSSLDPDGIKKQKILHLQYRDFNGDEFTEFKLKVPFGSASKLSFGFYSYNNSSLELQNVRLKSLLTNSEDMQSNLDLIGLNRTNLLESLELKTTKDDTGYNGKLIDVFNTKELLNSGEYTFSFSVTKLEKYNSNDDTFEIVAFDETGKELFQSAIEENDLSSFDPTVFVEDFEMTSARKVYFKLKFYGNSFGAFSDIRVEGINLTKKVL